MVQATRSGLLVLLMVVAVGCAPSGASPTVPTTMSPGPSVQPAPSPASSPMTNPTSDPSAQPMVDEVLASAARQLSLPSTDLRVERVEAREWPDSSLGCPRQGQMYAQVLTPGWLIVIASGERRLEYHTDTRGTVVLCSQS